MRGNDVLIKARVVVDDDYVDSNKTDISERRTNCVMWEDDNADNVQ